MSSAERRAVRSANWRKEHKVKKTHQDVDHRDDYDHDHGDDENGEDDGDVVNTRVLTSDIFVKALHMIA